MIPLALICAAVLSTNSSPPSGSIGFLKSDELVARCGEDSSASASYCLAFIAGVRDTAKAYEIWSGQKEFCMRPGITQTAIRDTFLEFVRRRPQLMAGQAASVVLLALKAGYPCHET